MHVQNCKMYLLYFVRATFRTLYVAMPVHTVGEGGGGAAEFNGSIHYFPGGGKGGRQDGALAERLLSN